MANFMYMKKHQRKSFVKKRLCNWNHVGTLKHLKIFSIQFQFSKISIYVHTEVYEKGDNFKMPFLQAKNIHNFSMYMQIVTYHLCSFWLCCANLKIYTKKEDLHWMSLLFIFTLMSRLSTVHEKSFEAEM